MNTVDKMFGVVDFTETEQDQIIEIFSNPLVVKYLTNMAREEIKELASVSALRKEDNEVSKMHSAIQGKLQVLSTLLSIDKGASS